MISNHLNITVDPTTELCVPQAVGLEVVVVITGPVDEVFGVVADGIVGVVTEGDVVVDGGGVAEGGIVVG